MKFRTICFSSVAALLIVSSCAYFNTFYNAKRYYRKAIYETRRNRTGKVSGAEKTNYGKAIEKSYKLIEFYPKSKYVDDALLMLGKSYYYQQDYLQANRKFLELDNGMPESELVPDARLWLAKTELALKQIPQAERRLDQLMESRLPGRLRGEAYFALGLIAEAKRDHEVAVSAFRRALDEGLEERMEEVVFSIAADLDTLGRLEEALEYFDRVLDMNILGEMRFDASIRHARILKQMGRFDEAIDEFELLLIDEMNKKKFPDVLLEIAECLLLMGDVDGAIITYDDVTKEYKRTPQSARAYFELGRLYEEHRQDYDKAVNNYEQVQSEYIRSEYADTARVLGRDIRRYRALEQVIRMGLRGDEGELILEDQQAEEDSLTLDEAFTMMESASTDSVRMVVLESIGGKAFLDSIQRERLILDRELERTGREPQPNRSGSIDWVAWLRKDEMPSFTEIEAAWQRLQNQVEKERKKLIENPELKTFNVDELDKNLLLLAELFLFRFNQPDSAAKQYLMLIDRFPESPYAPQALHNYAYIHEEILSDPAVADSSFDLLIRLYPASPYANIGREKLGKPIVYSREDSAGWMFALAESTLLDEKNPQMAFLQYRELYETHKNSVWAPKALYSMAWISETSWDSLDLALSLYDTLLVQYPDSKYAVVVKQKVTEAKSSLQRSESEKPMSQTNKEGPGVFTETSADSLSQERATGGLPVDEGNPAEDRPQPLLEPGEERKSPTEEVVPPDTGSEGQDVSDAKSSGPGRKEEETELNRAVSLVGGLEALRARIVIPESLRPEEIPEFILIEAKVDTEGTAVMMNIIRTSGQPVLDTACTDAVKKSQFLPALRNGKPMQSSYMIRIPLGQPRKEEEDETQKK